MSTWAWLETDANRDVCFTKPAVSSGNCGEEI